MQTPTVPAGIEMQSLPDKTDNNETSHNAAAQADAAFQPQGNVHAEANWGCWMSILKHFCRVLGIASVITA